MIAYRDYSRFYWKKISGQRLIYTAIVGKPMKETYYHAEYLISHHANQIGLKLPIKRLYAIGVCSSSIIRIFQT